MQKNRIQQPQQQNKSTEAGTVVRTEHFSGPLPHPDILAKYNAIVPDAAERILRRFEIQSDHRQKLEKTVVTTDSVRSIGGLICGFIIAIVAITGGIYASIQGHPFFGDSLTFTGLALIVGAFVSNKYFPPKPPQEITSKNPDDTTE